MGARLNRPATTRGTKPGRRGLTAAPHSTGIGEEGCAGDSSLPSAERKCQKSTVFIANETSVYRSVSDAALAGAPTHPNWGPRDPGQNVHSFKGVGKGGVRGPQLG